MHTTNIDLATNLILIHFNNNSVILKIIKPYVGISVHVLISVEMLSSTVQIFHNAVQLYILDYAPILQQH